MFPYPGRWDLLQLPLLLVTLGPGDGSCSPTLLEERTFQVFKCYAQNLVHLKQPNHSEDTI